MVPFSISSSMRVSERIMRKYNSCFRIVYGNPYFCAMSLYREWSVGDSLAAIWKIEEPEAFFAERTGLVLPDIANEKRRIEHLTGRFLLKHLKEDFPLLHITRDEHDKPRVPDYHFSISHSWPYVAAIINPTQDTGIDIQTWHPRIDILQKKFLSPDEQALFRNDNHLLTIAWCAKEAAYKWQGRRGVEFIDHLPIIHFSNTTPEQDIKIDCKLSTPSATVHLKSFTTDAFACSYVTGATRI